MIFVSEADKHLNEQELVMFSDLFSGVCMLMNKGQMNGILDQAMMNIENSDERVTIEALKKKLNGYDLHMINGFIITANR